MTALRWAEPEHHESIGSTNTEAMGDPRPGRVVVADHQSAGRGRLGRSWHSPPGSGMAISAVVPTVPTAVLGWLPLAAGLALAEALARHGRGEVGPAAVVDALRDARLLIPLVARLGEEGVGETGLKVDKSAELSIITVAGPDGRTVMPVFTSVAAMGRWNPAARPVPAEEPLRTLLYALSQA